MWDSSADPEAENTKVGRFQLGAIVRKGKRAYKVSHVVHVPDGDRKTLVLQRIEYQGGKVYPTPTGEVEFRICYYMKDKDPTGGWRFGQSAPFASPTALARLLALARVDIPDFAVDESN